MKTCIRATALAVGFAFCGAAGAASATEVIFFDDFNSDRLGGNAALVNWNVVSGSIDVIGWDGDRSWYDWYGSNGAYVDLAGSSQEAGKIETKTAFDLILGETYVLSFDYGKNRNRTTAETIIFGVGGFDGEINIAAGAISDYIHFAVELVATETLSTLYFGAVGDDNSGPIIDNVLFGRVSSQPVFAAAGPDGGVASATSVVPVPPALPLLFSALAGLAFLSRRRAR